MTGGRQQLKFNVLVEGEEKGRKKACHGIRNRESNNLGSSTKPPTFQNKVVGLSCLNSRDHAWVVVTAVWAAQGKRKVRVRVLAGWVCPPWDFGCHETGSTDSTQQTQIPSALFPCNSLLADATVMTAAGRSMAMKGGQAMREGG